MTRRALELQRRNAARKGHEVRSRRGRLKEHLTAGNITLSEVLRADKVHLHTMQLRQLLMAVPGLREAKVHRILTAQRIGPAVTLENFSHHRREELLSFIARSYPSVRV